MVVIATPINNAVTACCDHDNKTQTVNPVSCANKNVLSAAVTTVNGEENRTKLRSISIDQGHTVTVSWQLHDDKGAPIDLSTCVTGAEDSPYKIIFAMRPYIGARDGVNVSSIDGTVVDAATGQVSVDLTPAATRHPGIFYGEFSIAENVDTNEKLFFSNTFLIAINRTALGDSMQGPPSIAEIRLHLRDSSPSESLLLDNLMFDDAEIALAIARPVQYWNETPPPLNQHYTTSSFPFRYHWLEGICANLFFMVAEQYRRNQLAYQAGGLSVDDQNKEASYERAGQVRWQAFREWVRATKATLNLEGCYGQVTSNYKYSAYTDAVRIRY
jgi:hypothetical protein